MPGSQLRVSLEVAITWENIEGLLVMPYQSHAMTRQVSGSTGPRPARQCKNEAPTHSDPKRKRLCTEGEKP